MKKNHGINKLMALMLLGSIVFGNITLYKQTIPRERSSYSYEVKGLNESDNLDVGKAD
ncbi:PhrA family quorum-sensing system peptide [Streptococcus henryi]|uniref:PhrA family quorum-sensing system peptide n=1 Tax=Streptococcus henryi TaxID=439219 RepID=UPI00035EA5D0|nr:PhrA family quorum-sensing system peptide [Streptococcus henryi]